MLHRKKESDTIGSAIGGIAGQSCTGGYLVATTNWNLISGPDKHYYSADIVCPNCHCSLRVYICKGHLYSLVAISDYEKFQIECAACGCETIILWIKKDR